MMCLYFSLNSEEVVTLLLPKFDRRRRVYGFPAPLAVCVSIHLQQHFFVSVSHDLCYALEIRPIVQRAGGESVAQVVCVFQCPVGQPPNEGEAYGAMRNPRGCRNTGRSYR